MPEQAHDWLTGFQKALSASQCRINGKDAPLQDGYARAEGLIAEAGKAGKTVWWAANGGSATIGAHLSQDLINKLKIRSDALTNHSLLTCMANDYGYEQVYARPLETLARPGDLLVAISSSGNSKNILNCLDVAEKSGLKTLTLSGFSGSNKLWNRNSDVAFYFPSDLYGHVESGHLVLLHAIIETLVLKSGK